MHRGAASGEVFIKRVYSQDLASFRSVLSGWDSRLLSVLKNPSGLPQYTLSSSVRDSKQENADRIKMAPSDVRSAEWCLGYLETEGVGFKGHHERVRRLAGVDGGARGTSEHFQAMVQLKQGPRVDQVDGTNRLLSETLLRRAQGCFATMTWPLLGINRHRPFVLLSSWRHAREQKNNDQKGPKRSKNKEDEE